MTGTLRWIKSLPGPLPKGRNLRTLQTNSPGSQSQLAEPRAAGAAHSRVVSPGRNCWRLAHARRAAVLIDGAEYFARLESALRQARHSVLILGWDFDGRIRLCADAEPDRSPQLGPWLRSLVEARPELRVRVLVWSTAVVRAERPRAAPRRGGLAEPSALAREARHAPSDLRGPSPQDRRHRRPHRVRRRDGPHRPSLGHEPPRGRRPAPARS